MKPAKKLIIAIDDPGVRGFLASLFLGICALLLVGLLMTSYAFIFDFNLYLGLFSFGMGLVILYKAAVKNVEETQQGDPND